MPTLFDATSTAQEVLEGVGLRNCRVLVTGVSSGVGVETVRVLAAHGAHVVGAARNLDKARRATEQVRAQVAPGGGLDLVELDLASLASIRACSDKLVKSGGCFDVVIANAGVMALPKGMTADGVETQFGTNYLGHFAFVNRIASLINPCGRLVMVASAGHRGADVDLDDPNFEHTPYDPLVAYRRSKTATILFAVEFDRRHEGGGVRATAVHPGAVLTETTRKMIEDQPSAAKAFKWKSVEQGAATSVWAGFVQLVIRSAATIAKTVTSPRSTTTLWKPSVHWPTRWTSPAQKRCGPRARKWWTSVSDELDGRRSEAARAEPIQIPRQRSLPRHQSIDRLAMRCAGYSRPTTQELVPPPEHLVPARMGRGPTSLPGRQSCNQFSHHSGAIQERGTDHMKQETATRLRRERATGARRLRRSHR